ncbi:hypothetical protein ATY81_03610 [Rhizobium sp. R72]|nr:hypothetical protein ATY81_03610 [Rhizobium sp. R72]OWW06116.1 hypothetical protein ATY80_03610 [Rhizobium sp. R711]
MITTKDNLFKPEKPSAQAKSDQTTSVASDILAEEATRPAEEDGKTPCTPLGGGSDRSTSQTEKGK